MFKCNSITYFHNLNTCELFFLAICLEKKNFFISPCLPANGTHVKFSPIFNIKLKWHQVHIYPAACQVAQW